MSDATRSAVWHPVWNRRNPAVVHMNGADKCFADRSAYHAFVSEQARFVTSTLRLEPRDRLVDLGCGTGLLASLLAPQVEAILALDYSEHALEIARAENHAPNITYRRADLSQLATADLDGNKAFAMGVFHYLDDYEVARRLVEGLLRQGAEILVGDVPDERLRDRVTRAYDMERFSHLYFDEDRLRADFPGIRIRRGVFPAYPNDVCRFSFHVVP